MVGKPFFYELLVDAYAKSNLLIHNPEAGGSMDAKVLSSLCKEIDSRHGINPEVKRRAEHLSFIVGDYLSDIVSSKVRSNSWVIVRGNPKVYFWFRHSLTEQSEAGKDASYIPAFSACLPPGLTMPNGLNEIFSPCEGDGYTNNVIIYLGDFTTPSSSSLGGTCSENPPDSFEVLENVLDLLGGNDKPDGILYVEEELSNQTLENEVFKYRTASEIRDLEDNRLRFFSMAISYRLRIPLDILSFGLKDIVDFL